MPSDFEDEEIDEDEAFNSDDEMRYGDVNFAPSLGGRKKSGGKVGRCKSNTTA